MAAPFEPDWRIILARSSSAALLWQMLQRWGGGLLALALGMIACAGLGAKAGVIRHPDRSHPVEDQ